MTHVHGRRLQRLYAGAVGCAMSLSLWAAEAEPTTVYRSVGPDGVVSFSDAPNASAVPIEVLPPPMPLKEDVERANRAFDQQLALLELLEKSRQARAKEELEMRALELDYVQTTEAADRARQQEAQYDGDVYYPFLPWVPTLYPPYGPGRYPPHHPVRPQPPIFRPPGSQPPMNDRPPPPSPPQHVQFPH